MTLRVKALVCAVVIGGAASFGSALGRPAQQWLHFFVYLAATLLSSGLKVAMPKTEATMSVNFPFILLGILQLSPLQAIALAVLSVLAQSRIRVIKPFTLTQILFNVANVTTATLLAWESYAGLIRYHVQIAPALALAATVYFLANTIPVALVLAWDSDLPAFIGWRQNYLWYLPFYLVGAGLAATANLVGVIFGWMTSLLLIPMVYTMYRAYAGQIETVRDRERHIVETEALHLRTIEGLAMAIEAKDKNTHGHLMRVRTYVSELGKIMGLDQSLMQALQTASFLHDIGKLAVPEHIINKPGKLTPEEFEKMKIHPVVGANILERVRFPYPVVPIVRSHHEAWDGSGYPDGLKGEQIPIGARILTAVDCFDALASERPYRRALPLDEAMAFLKSRAGIQFDPAIVQLLDEHYLELEEIAHDKIEEIEPLKEEMVLDRGAAPAAGFAPEPRCRGQIDMPDSSCSDAQGAGQTREFLDPLATTSEESMAILGLSGRLSGSIGVIDDSTKLSTHLQPFIPFDCLAVYGVANDAIQLRYIDGAFTRAFSPRPIPVGEGLSGWVAQSERFIINGNPTVEPNYLVETGLFSASGSALSLPIYNSGAAVAGVLTVYSAQSAAFSRDHLQILQDIQSIFSLYLEKGLQLARAESDARNDCASEVDDTQSLPEEIGENDPDTETSAAL